MREFIYYSTKARTSGNWDDPMKAGRMDIVFNVVIQAFFLSNNIRDDMKLHLIFNGPPNPPMHLILEYDPEIPISKKDIGSLIKKMLYKCNNEKMTKVFPGCYIEKKSFKVLLHELENEGKKIMVLDKKGEPLRQIKTLDNCVFVIGDHDGLPFKELKQYKNRISIGRKLYFASQAFIIVHNELDLRTESI